MSYLVFILIGITSWIVRYWFDTEAAVQDLLLLALFTLPNYGTPVLELFFASSKNYCLTVTAGLGVMLSTCILASLYRYFDQREQPGTLATNGDSQGGPATPLKPLLFPCRTNHTRFFPKKHSFSYSYLLVGLPIRCQGLINALDSAEPEALPGNGFTYQHYNKRVVNWFSIDPANYLSRGDGHLGLKAKLHAYLRSQGSKPEDYPYVYLVTAPRFLGYSFNPVSFWYLYSSNRELKAMILEVNNTFDERRIYLLTESTSGKDVDCTSANAGSNECRTSGEASAIKAPHADRQTKTSSRFCGKWLKDFHVSPFNSRKGTYSLTAFDPLFSPISGKGPIDNTITLTSSKTHAKLVARISSTGLAIDPVQLNTWSNLNFFVSWWWVGFMTFPRILKEAGKLFFQKSLRIWYKPEVSRDSIPRHENRLERTLEQCFRAFLQAQVQQSDHDVAVKYNAAGSRCRQEETFFSAKRPPNGTNNEERLLEFKVLAPHFYTRVTQYTDIAEALEAEMLCAREQDRTIWLSKPELLPIVFAASYNKKQSRIDDVDLVRLKHLDRWRWSALSRLRRVLKSSLCRRYEVNVPSAPGSVRAMGLRCLDLSLMDVFVLRRCAPKQVQEYRQAVTKYLIGQHIALGITELFDLADIILRMFLAWVALQTLRTWFELPFGIEHAFSRHSLVLFFDRSTLLTIVFSNNMHIWAYLKSFL